MYSIAQSKFVFTQKCEGKSHIFLDKYSETHPKSSGRFNTKRVVTQKRCAQRSTFTTDTIQKPTNVVAP